MVAIALSLMLRTYADVWMIQTSTKIEAAIISRHKPLFGAECLRVEIALPRTADSPFYAQYLDGFTFYKMTSLDNRIANADQLLAQDVDRFCEGIIELYSNLSKRSAAHCCWLTSQLQQRTVGGGGGTKICRLFIGGLSHETTDEQSNCFAPIFGTASSRPNLHYLSCVRAKSEHQTNYEQIECPIRCAIETCTRRRARPSSSMRGTTVFEHDRSVLTFWTTTNDEPN
ncbi:hypothetical protein niasHT_012222 [Heterodera trifolii]|uniref:ABC transmembrane type-1 domain-containing protein n=1 Tax=Heterodera trifolii TaxID=157864 RepID=A0ABD2KZN5_9BILA